MNEFPTQLREGAIQTHEVFLEYVRAGFTEQQALYLVGCLLRKGTDS